MRILTGDCRVRLRELSAESIDAVVTDPPYGLEFMGKEWDKLVVSTNESGPQSEGWHDNGGRNPYARRATPRYGGKQLGWKGDVNLQQQEWHYQWAVEVFRVLKPGGHVLAFGGTRTFHRLACALEDAGFEIRDTLQWLYGTGFPKSLNVGGGWGTALKPGYEPIILARKPLIGVVKDNVLQHGTGALNIDGCRVAFQSEADLAESITKNQHEQFGSGPRENKVYGQDTRDRPKKGRWPANVVLSHHPDCVQIGTKQVSGGHVGQEGLEERYVDGETVEAWDCYEDCPIRMLDTQSSERGMHGAGRARSGQFGGDYAATSYDMSGPREMGRFGDIGGASRFFYCAKASRSERNQGLDPAEFPKGNVHPTVKPVALMRWLVRLITPSGGTVLDPFMGSGSTGLACQAEHVAFIGIEQDPDSVKTACARLGGVVPESAECAPEPSLESAPAPAVASLGVTDAAARAAELLKKYGGGL